MKPTETLSTKKQEELPSSPSPKPELLSLPKGTKSIVRKFENLQNRENVLTKKNTEIYKSSLGGGTGEMKAKVLGLSFVL